MALIPFSPWVCVKCGLVTRNSLFAPDCCEEQFAIQVRVEVPGAEDPFAAAAAADLAIVEEVEAA